MGPAWLRCQLHVFDERQGKQELQLMLQRYMGARMTLPHAGVVFGVFSLVGAVFFFFSVVFGVCFWYAFCFGLELSFFSGCSMLDWNFNKCPPLLVKSALSWVLMKQISVTHDNTLHLLQHT